MAHSTLDHELFHSGSNTLKEDLKKGRRPNMYTMDMHMVRGYADSRASAGRGAMWSFHIPTILWTRGMAFGAIKSYPGNPGCSYLIDSDFILKNYSHLYVERVG